MLEGVTLVPALDGSIDLAGAPRIPGLVVRAYRDADDVPRLVELYRAVNAADGNTEAWTVETLRLELEHPTHIDPRVDGLLVFVDDQLVAASHIEWADTTAGVRHYRSMGHVHPDWRRRGIGGALLTRNERRLAQLAAGHRLEKPPQLITYLEERDEGGVALFRSRGYQRVRLYHHMVRPDLEDILVPAMPQGLEVRPVGREQLPQLWDALIEAFRDHFGGHDGSPQAYRRWSEDPTLDLSLAVIAFDGDEVAGGVLGYIDVAENEAQGYRRGWADPVFTRRPWRRRGLASALLGRTLVRLEERGMTSAQLDVDSENPNQALGLYQRHRFEADRSSSEWHRPLEVQGARGPVGPRVDGA